MVITFKAHYDGKTLVLEEPASLPIDVSMDFSVDVPSQPENKPKEKRKRVWGQFKDQIRISSDFDSPLPDSFWGFDK